MKMNFLNRNAMYLRLRFPELFENLRSIRLSAMRERSALNHRKNMMQMAVLLILLRKMNPEFRRRDTATASLFNFIAGPGIERFKSGDQFWRGGAGINQSADSHVAADPRERVEVTD